MKTCNCLILESSTSCCSGIVITLNSVGPLNCALWLYDNLGPCTTNTTGLNRLVEALYGKCTHCFQCIYVVFNASTCSLKLLVHLKPSPAELEGIFFCCACVPFMSEYLRLKKNSIEKKSGSLSVSCFGNFGRIERHGYLNRTMLETWFLEDEMGFDQSEVDTRRWRHVGHECTLGKGTGNKAIIVSSGATRCFVRICYLKVDSVHGSFA